MDRDEKQAWVDRTLAFLRPLGIEARPDVVEHETILLGMEIRGGIIWYDRDLRIRPGDLLHEAGHLAVADPARRNNPVFEADGGDELSAIAWSYAASKAMGMPIEVLFHEEGHGADAESWTDAFEAGNYFGLPLLHLYGMTIEPRQARPGDPPVYPHMLSWIRTAPGLAPPPPTPSAPSFDAQAVTETIVGFIRSLGLRVEIARLEGQETVLPGMTIRRGVIFYDPDLPYGPGDLLHEAGHLAVCLPERRNADPFDATGGDELGATAWSFAAGRHLGLPTEVVFHPPSFRETGDAMRENFDEGRYIGVPGLHRLGMAIEPRQAKPDGPPPYPHMLRWLR